MKQRRKLACEETSTTLESRYKILEIDDELLRRFWTILGQALWYNQDACA